MITVILNGYKRPENLNEQLEALKNQFHNLLKILNLLRIGVKRNPLTCGCWVLTERIMYERINHGYFTRVQVSPTSAL